MTIIWFFRLHYYSNFPIPEAANVGDYVLVHAGFALRNLDEQEAKETLDLMRKIAQGLEQEDNDYSLTNIDS